MVIHQIDIMGMTGLETEDDPPVGADNDSPEARQVSSELVQSETGQIHVAYRGGFVQTGQNALDLVHLIGPDIAAFPSLIEPPQSPMPKILYHETTVMCHMSRVKRLIGFAREDDYLRQEVIESRRQVLTSWSERRFYFPMAII
jgi:hypothetical protein